MQNTDFIPEEKKINKNNFTSGEIFKKLKLTLILTIGKVQFTKSCSI